MSLLGLSVGRRVHARLHDSVQWMKINSITLGHHFRSHPISGLALFAEPSLMRTLLGHLFIQLSSIDIALIHRISCHTLFGETIHEWFGKLQHYLTNFQVNPGIGLVEEQAISNVPHCM